MLAFLLLLVITAPPPAPATAPPPAPAATPAPALPAPLPPQTGAVLDFQSAPRDRALAQRVARAVRAEAAKHEGKILEPAEMNERLPAAARSCSKACTDAARLLGVDFVISGSVTREGAAMLLKLWRSPPNTMITGGELYLRARDEKGLALEAHEALSGMFEPPCWGGGPSGEPLVGDLDLEIAPRGAQLLVDGRQYVSRACETLKMQAAPGPHRLQARLSGYLSAERTVVVEANETVKVRLVLERAAPK